jgi:hypothetical protein
VSDAGWLLNGWQPKHPLDLQPSSGSGGHDRSGEDASRVLFLARAAVCAQAAAVIQPLLPASLPPALNGSSSSSSSSSSVGVARPPLPEGARAVRRVSGGLLGAYRTVWGPYEEVLVESPTGVVVGGAAHEGALNGSFMDAKGGGPSLTVKEPTTHDAYAYAPPQYHLRRLPHDCYGSVCEF